LAFFNTYVAVYTQSVSAGLIFFTPPAGSLILHHVRGKLKLFWTLSRRHLQNVAWLEGSHSQLAKFIGPMAGFHRHFHRPAVGMAVGPTSVLPIGATAAR